MKLFKKISALSLSFLLISTMAFALARPFVNGTVTVTAATSTSRTQGPTLAVSSCTFQTPSTNAGIVYLGGSTVTNASGANVGIALAAGSSLSNAGLDNLSWLYFAADNANDVVKYLCN